MYCHDSWLKYKPLLITILQSMWGVFLDISKAFDKFLLSGLVFKSKSYGVEGELLALLKSYLQNREQRVFLNGQISGWRKFNSGIPQGSLLGPLLFLPDGIISTCKIFVDDTSLFSKVLHINKFVTELNTDLGKISQWAYQWKCILIMILTNKQIKLFSPIK